MHNPINTVQQTAMYIITEKKNPRRREGNDKNKGDNEKVKIPLVHNPLSFCHHEALPH